MENIITCPKCGWNYEWPMFTTTVPNCPRCFPVETKTTISTTDNGVSGKDNTKQEDVTE